MTKLLTTELSNCCEAMVTEQGLCSDCKEHCSTIVTQDVSVWVLDFKNVEVRRIVMTIQYDKEDGDVDMEVESTLSDYLGHSNIQWMWSDVSEIDFLDEDIRQC